MIAEFVEESLPRLEEAGFIFRYSWFYTRYYIDHDHTSNPWFWLDSYNKLAEQINSSLADVMRIFHLCNLSRHMLEVDTVRTLGFV